jgi:large subunit ribosomal protein L25
MASSTITAARRSSGINPRALRRSGRIPAVLYGHRGTESLSVELDAHDVEVLLKHAVVNNTVCQLKVARGWSGKVLLREVQLDAFQNRPLHLSFFAIAGHGSIHLDVPLVLHGEPVGVRVDRGVLDRTLDHLSVVAAAEAIPEVIDVDVSHLGVGDVLYVGDLVLPAGIEATNPPDTAVVTVTPSTTGLELESIASEDEALPATVAGVGDREEELPAD